VVVGVAADRSNNFLYEKSFDLRGTPPAAGRPAEEDVLVEYKLDDPLAGNEFNLRVKMYHYGTNQAQLTNGFIDWEFAEGPTALREAGRAAQA